MSKSRQSQHTKSHKSYHAIERYQQTLKGSYRRGSNRIGRENHPINLTHLLITAMVLGAAGLATAQEINEGRSNDLVRSGKGSSIKPRSKELPHIEKPTVHTEKQKTKRVVRNKTPVTVHEEMAEPREVEDDSELELTVCQKARQAMKSLSSDEARAIANAKIDEYKSEHKTLLLQQVEQALTFPVFESPIIGELKKTREQALKAVHAMYKLKMFRVISIFEEEKIDYDVAEENISALSTQLNARNNLERMLDHVYYFIDQLPQEFLKINYFIEYINNEVDKSEVLSNLQCYERFKQLQTISEFFLIKLSKKVGSSLDDTHDFVVRSKKELDTILDEEKTLAKTRLMEMIAKLVEDKPAYVSLYSSEFGEKFNKMVNKERNRLYQEALSENTLTIYNPQEIRRSIQSNFEEFSSLIAELIRARMDQRSYRLASYAAIGLCTALVAGSCVCRKCKSKKTSPQDAKITKSAKQVAAELKASEAKKREENANKKAKSLAQQKAKQAKEKPTIKQPAPSIKPEAKLPEKKAESEILKEAIQAQFKKLDIIKKDIEERFDKLDAAYLAAKQTHTDLIAEREKDNAIKRPHDELQKLLNQYDKDKAEEVLRKEFSADLEQAALFKEASTNTETSAKLADLKEKLATFETNFKLQRQLGNYEEKLREALNNLDKWIAALPSTSSTASAKNTSSTVAPTVKKASAAVIRPRTTMRSAPSVSPSPSTQPQSSAAIATPAVTSVAAASSSSTSEIDDRRTGGEFRKKNDDSDVGTSGSATSNVEPAARPTASAKQVKKINTHLGALTTLAAAYTAHGANDLEIYNALYHLTMLCNQCESSSAGKVYGLRLSLVHPEQKNWWTDSQVLFDLVERLINSDSTRSIDERLKIAIEAVSKVNKVLPLQSPTKHSTVSSAGIFSSQDEQGQTQNLVKVLKGLINTIKSYKKELNKADHSLAPYYANAIEYLVMCVVQTIDDLPRYVTKKWKGVEWEIVRARRNKTAHHSSSDMQEVRKFINVDLRQFVKHLTSNGLSLESNTVQTTPDVSRAKPN